MSLAEYRAGLRRAGLNAIVMADIDHPDGMLRVWSGIGMLDYDGYTYSGLGELGSIEGMKSDVEIEVPKVTLGLSGVDPALIAGLSDSVKNRTADIWEAWIDRHYRVRHRRGPWSVRLDYQRYALGEDGKATIFLVGYGGMFHLLKRSNARWTPEEAHQQYPDEVGFDEMHLQEDSQLVWKAS
ncbi:MAG: hypothetical protein AB7F22_10655 [Reyranella sp.]|uniref:hypothetical protein n=1 Tax=Reyranella sp. TaxID=1929291 RepID=UPI003D0B408B